MDRLRRLSIAAASLLFLPFGLEPSAHGTSLKSPCYQVTFKERPLWVSSATWRADTGELLVVDPMQNKLLVYGLDGALRPSPSFLLKPKEEFQPNSISPVEGDGFLLELASGTLVQLDKDLRTRPEDPISPPEKSTGGYRVGSLFQWRTAGDNLVSYGSLLKGEQVTLGFFRLKLGSPENPELLTPLAQSSFYLIGNSYITSIDGTAYYVAMDRHPAIYKAAPGRQAHRLTAFPEEFRTRPDFKTRMAGPSSAPLHFAELETFTVASGLFSQGRDLFLLARRPEAPGQTAWFLYKIDPEKDTVVGQPLRLPTSADFLTVVPTKDNWILIERGPVKELQRQTIDRMVVLNASSISAMTPLPTSCPVQ